ncbi:MAG: MobA-like transferase domain containing protein [Firmicutes bacterium]|nr:MobA-like transferase domain containing protein [Bacillota bacterium]
MVDAIILAGGHNSKPLRRFASEQYEALIDINGRPMVTYVAQALSASRNVDRIFVVGPNGLLETCDFPDCTTIVESGRTIIDTIVSGMKALGHERHVLVVTADIPLLSPQAIDDFIAKCSPVSADMYYPIVSKTANEQQYPGNKRTYVRLQEGTFTGGNIFLVNPAIVTSCLYWAKRIINNRKNPLKLAHVLGWIFVFKFLLGTLALQEVENRVSELLKINGMVVESAFPELGLDVDKPSDLELVRQLFAEQA